ncbi:MAG: amidase [Balneolaceae bacterium]
MRFDSLQTLLSGILIGSVGIGAIWFISTDEIDLETVREAEKLIGLEYSDEQREIILGNLQQNPAIYRELRELHLPNHVPLPLYFNPVPPGKYFSPPPEVDISWVIPDDTERPASLDELAFYSIPELASLLRNRKVTSVELTELFLKRLEDHDEQLEAVVTLTRERALRQAAALDRELDQGVWRGPLHGIPYGAKDLFAVEGYPTTWGAMPYRDQVLDETATVIRKLDEAGAILIAKLSLGALAYGDIWFGGRTNNPWNSEQGSSGSSAGSSAAVSAGLVPFSLGTETLGSLVSPAVRTGTTTLRPTFGRVSRHGAMALSWTMDKVGPMARSAEDAAIVFDIIRGPDGYDHTVQDWPFNYERLENLEGIRIGVAEESFSGEYSNASNDRAVLDLLESLGAELIPIKLPELPTGFTFNLLTAEAAAAFEELTLSGRDSLMVWSADNAWPHLFRGVRFVPAVEWIQMNRVRSELIRKMDETLEGLDLYVTPPFRGNNLTISNLTGLPSLVIRNGFDEGGLPTSITLGGQLYGEDILMAVGDLYQRTTGFHLKHPSQFLPGNAR